MQVVEYIFAVKKSWNWTGGFFLIYMQSKIIFRNIENMGRQRRVIYMIAGLHTDNKDTVSVLTLPIRSSFYPLSSFPVSDELWCETSNMSKQVERCRHFMPCHNDRPVNIWAIRGLLVNKWPDGSLIHRDGQNWMLLISIVCSWCHITWHGNPWLLNKSYH